MNSSLKTSNQPKTILANSRDWQPAEKAVSRQVLWPFLLIVVGSFSSAIYPHVPLVGFAVLAGNTLPRKRAIATASTIWLANQLYGFTIRQYPQTAESFTWGLVMGIGTLIVTYLVTLLPRWIPLNFRGYLLRLTLGIVGGYAFYEGAIVAIAQLMGGHGFTAAILWRIFVKNAIWAAGLSAVHSILVRRKMQTFSRTIIANSPPSLS